MDAVIDWVGLYSSGWTGLIVPQAFSHPAKFARGLIERIYEYAFERGWLAEGQVVLDPFGGVALGGLEAMRRGCQWVGVELEEKFVALGQQNLDLWNGRYAAHMPHWGTATLLLGDSRKLGEIVGRVDAAIASPPYSGTLGSGEGPGARYDFKTHSPDNAVKQTCMPDYGTNPSNLGNMPAGNVADVIVSSSPWQGGTSGHDKEFDKTAASIPSRKNAGAVAKEYGTSPGQLAAMPPGGFVDAVVSSSPWENQIHGKDEKWLRAVDQDQATRGLRYSAERHHMTSYGDTDGNIGNETSTTFWSAARTILAETYAVLKPGGVSIWVCKRFVRNKQIVEFPEQWAQLCESVGFERLEWIRAWLVEDRGAQWTMDNGLERKTVERKSFFRRLAEKKGSPRIDWEDVIVMRKPDGEGAGVDAVCSSPVYPRVVHDGGDTIDWSKTKDGGKQRTVARAAPGLGYGSTPGNLGNLPATEDDWREALTGISECDSRCHDTSTEKDV